VSCDKFLILEFDVYRPTARNDQIQKITTVEVLHNNFIEMSSTSMAIIGDGSVGKSAIINAFKAEGFLSTYIQTVGFQVYEKRLQLRGDTFVSLQLWDIGGQSINSKNLENYLASAKIVLLVYDTTNLESFLNIEDWLVIARKYTAKASLYLVGNKIDLIALRQIPQNQHDQYIIENNIKGGFFFSAKTGENVLKGFYQAAGDSVGLNLSQQELGNLIIAIFALSLYFYPCP
jgi:Ras-related protein Rab-28